MAAITEPTKRGELIHFYIHFAAQIKQFDARDPGKGERQPKLMTVILGTGNRPDFPAIMLCP